MSEYTVKHAYSEYTHDELTVLVKWFSFLMGFKLIVKLMVIRITFIAKQNSPSLSLHYIHVYKSLLTWFIMLKLSEIYWKITTINVNIATFVFYFTRVGEFLIIYPGLKNICSSEPSPVFTFRQKDRVIHLTLLSVRKRYRKFGIGKYLLQVCIIIKIRSFSTSTY